MKNNYYISSLSFISYVGINSIIYSLFSILLKGKPLLLLYGFTCVANNNLLNIIFYSLLVLVKAFMAFLFFYYIKRKSAISLVFFSLLFIDMLSLIFYGVDIFTDTYFRFIFFSSASLYTASGLFHLSYITIPLVFFIIGLLAIKKLYRATSLKTLLNHLFSICLSVLLFYFIISNLFKISS